LKVTLREFEDDWSWGDAYEAHWVLDELEDARRRAQPKQRKKG
jgi:hypothetical protein